jgi:uncharacterized membrane protein YkoI
MRRGVLIALTVGFVATGSSAMALAKDNRSSGRTADGQRFELRIDPKLDAAFGPRVVGGARAADIVVARLGGGRVTRVELDEVNGRPIWEVKVVLGGAERELDVDATNGQILAR